MMGVGLAAAILVDATLIRLVMLPVALVLLGERVWARGTPARRRPPFAPHPSSGSADPNAGTSTGRQVSQVRSRS